MNKHHVLCLWFTCRSVDPPFVLVESNSHIPSRSHVAPIPFPCHAVPLFCLSHLIHAVRPRLIHTCHAAPVPCHDHAVLKATSLGHGTARHGHGMAWHGMCELASAVLKRHVGDLPAFGFFRLPRGVPRSFLSEA
jgi:hypothetical protein